MIPERSLPTEQLGLCVDLQVTINYINHRSGPITLESSVLKGLGFGGFRGLGIAGLYHSSSGA